MRYSADWRSLAFLAGFTIYRGVVFSLETSMQGILLPLTVWTLMLAMAIKHNHIHLPVFRSPGANRLYDTWLNLLTGTSTSSMKIIHLMNHHRHHDGPEDWGQTAQFATSRPAVAFWRALWRTPGRFWRGKQAWLRAHPGHFLARYVKVETAVMVSIYLGLLLWRPGATWLTVLMPGLIGQFLLTALNYLQHYGCAPHSAMQHSRNFTGRWFNYLAFNVGFHTMHHLRPGLHWSLLPPAFAQIESEIEPGLCEPDFWRAVRRVLVS